MEIFLGALIALLIITIAGAVILDPERDAKPEDYCPDCGRWEGVVHESDCYERQVERLTAERDKLKNRLEHCVSLSDRNRLLRAIGGAIRASIHDHGPVTKELTPSAAKRVYGALKGEKKLQKRADGVQQG